MPMTRSRAPTAAAYRRAGLAASIAADCRLPFPIAQNCYRHPDRETGVSCSSCGRPICPDCMTPTPVGMRCPECAAKRTRVQRLSSVGSEPRVTVGIIIACAVVFLATNGFSGGSGKLWTDLYLDGPDVHFGHDYWRLVTSGFLHSGPIH